MSVDIASFSRSNSAISAVLQEARVNTFAASCEQQLAHVFAAYSEAAPCDAGDHLEC